MDITGTWLFLGAALLLIVTPGPDMMYVTARSLSQGRRAGLLSALGVCSGLVVHVLAATGGLSALLRTSIVLFTVIRYAGAAYLLVLGIRTIARRCDSDTTNHGPGFSSRRIYAQGIITNVLNPKVALFFLAFFPQFVSPSARSVEASMLLLGGIFVSLTFVWLACLALVSGSLGQRLGANAGIQRTIKWVSGLALIGLGLRIAIASRT